jgi:hypothetical protein
MLPYTKPCRNCAKPIRKDAPNCWFCGDVFDIVRCVECGHPIKIGSPACQICGEEAPEPPPPKPIPAASPDAPPPAAKRADEQDCPECGGPVPLAAIQCKHCGEQLDGPTRRKRGGPRWGGKTYAPHRGGTILAVALLSFICLGIVVAPLAVVLAIGDLKAMSEERMDPDGAGLTWAGLVVGVISALLNIAAGTLIVLGELR